MASTIRVSFGRKPKDYLFLPQPMSGSSGFATCVAPTPYAEGFRHTGSAFDFQVRYQKLVQSRSQRLAEHRREYEIIYETDLTHPSREVLQTWQQDQNDSIGYDLALCSTFARWCASVWNQEGNPFDTDFQDHQRSFQLALEALLPDLQQGRPIGGQRPLMLAQRDILRRAPKYPLGTTETQWLLDEALHDFSTPFGNTPSTWDYYSCGFRICLHHWWSLRSLDRRPDRGLSLRNGTFRFVCDQMLDAVFLDNSGDRSKLFEDAIHSHRRKHSSNPRVLIVAPHRDALDHVIIQQGLSRSPWMNDLLGEGFDRLHIVVRPGVKQGVPLLRGLDLDVRSKNLGLIPLVGNSGFQHLRNISWPDGNEPILLFPTGTFEPFPHTLSPFYSGALRSLARQADLILPIAIRHQGQQATVQLGTVFQRDHDQRSQRTDRYLALRCWIELKYLLFS